jgi:hypothetical protein
MTKHDKKPKKDVDASLDEALEDSFPTSDPPSHTNPSQGTVRDKERLKEHRPGKL